VAGLAQDSWASALTPSDLCVAKYRADQRDRHTDRNLLVGAICISGSAGVDFCTFAD
jgi:hypothetical protein